MPIAVIQTTTQLAPSLTGLPTGQNYAQMVFNIGASYIFYSTGNANQCIGHLIHCDKSGVPISIVATNINIAPNGLPFSPSWNSGHCIHVTVADKDIVMFARAANSNQVWRGIWNEENKRFENFTNFVTFSNSMPGNNYNHMTRINDTTIKLVTQGTWVAKFNIVTGEIIQNSMSVGGTWSPSSYPFSNAFANVEGYMFGASGDGNNWYVQYENNACYHDNPADNSGMLVNFNNITTACHWIFPSQHYPVSYYTPNNGTITAYKIENTYLAPLNERPSLSSIYEQLSSLVSKYNSITGISLYDKECDDTSFKLVDVNSVLVFSIEIQKNDFKNNTFYIPIDRNLPYFTNAKKYSEIKLTAQADDGKSIFTQFGNMDIYYFKDGTNDILYNKSFTTKIIKLNKQVKKMLVKADFSGGFVVIAVSTDGGSTYKITELDSPIEVTEGSNLVLKFFMSVDAEIRAYSLHWF